MLNKDVTQVHNTYLLYTYVHECINTLVLGGMETFMSYTINAEKYTYVRMLAECSEVKHII